jgi:outer membrane receptor protein involved in Fe transport
MAKKWIASYNRLALALSAAGLGLAAQQALAQQQPAQSQQALEQVTVTGSRLVTSGTNTPVPVTAVSGVDLQNMNPGELINSLSQLPQFYNNLSTQQAVGGSVAPGGSNVNLRGLSAQRTLVLLDGHRLGPSNKFGTVDIGVIPENLVRSVEAVTGGASAQYGADAVAGVVNFRLDRTFSGLKYSVQGGSTTYRDDNNYKGSVAFGTDVGQRGHIIASVETYHKDGIRSLKSIQDRSWYDLKARVTNPDPNGPTWLREHYVQPTNYTPGGIIGSFPPFALPKDAAGNVVPLPAALDHLEFLPDGSGRHQILPFSGIGQYAGGCNCQAQPTLDYGVNSDYQIDAPADRISMFTHYDYNVNARNNFYIETLLADTSDSLSWQTAALLLPWVGRVYADNAFLPADIAATMTNNGVDSVGFGIFTPNTPGNPFYGSQLNAKNRYGQFTSGFTHNLPDSFLAGGWELDGFVQYAQNRQETVVPGGMRTDRLFLAMDAVNDPVTGQPACRVALPQYDPTYYQDFSACVPIDLFGGTAAVSPAAANYVTDDGKIARGRTTESDAEVTFRGTLTKGSGGVLGPISAAFGLSWREEQLNVRTIDPCDEYPCTLGGVRLSDLGIMSPDLRGIEAETLPDGSVNPNGVPGLRYVPPGFSGDSNSSTVLFSSQRAVSGGYNDREAFFEFGIPLLKDGKLNLDESFRAVSYTGSGNTQAWKSGISYQATPTLRVRATRSQDVRAPTLQERFESQRGGVGVFDPQVGENISTASFSGGNPNVGLEHALTDTVGIVYQPVDKFSMTIDGYDINMSDAIGQLPAQTIVNNCYNSGGASSLCQYVHRDATGEINRVDALYINLSNERVRGADLELNYSGINVGQGTLSWRLLGARLNENSITTPGTAKDDRAGDIGSFGAGLPKNKVTTSLTYASGPISVFLQARYIGGGKLDRNLVQSSVAIPGVQTIADNTVDPVTYTDLSFTFNGGKSSSAPWQFFATVNNLFNTAPPAVYNGLGRTGTPGPGPTTLYDTIGRRFAVGIRVNY